MTAGDAHQTQNHPIFPHFGAVAAPDPWTGDNPFLFVSRIVNRFQRYDTDVGP